LDNFKFAELLANTMEEATAAPIAVSQSSDGGEPPSTLAISDPKRSKKRKRGTKDEMGQWNTGAGSTGRIGKLMVYICEVIETIYSKSVREENSWLQGLAAPENAWCAYMRNVIKTDLLVASQILGNYLSIIGTPMITESSPRLPEAPEDQDVCTRTIMRIWDEHTQSGNIDELEDQKVNLSQIYKVYRNVTDDRIDPNCLHLKLSHSGFDETDKFTIPGYFGVTE
jgi:hypothetical protein